jgi:hypothetical protein
VQAKLSTWQMTPISGRTRQHPAFFADHGVIHVRDVAQQVLS